MEAFLHEAAKQELLEAAEFYESKLPGLAAGSLYEFEKAVGRILSHPKAGAVFSESNRYQLLRRFPYTIFYNEVQENITVLAIAHQSRKPGYWVDRNTR